MCVFSRERTYVKLRYVYKAYQIVYDESSETNQGDQVWCDPSRHKADTVVPVRLEHMDRERRYIPHRILVQGQVGQKAVVCEVGWMRIMSRRIFFANEAHGHNET